MDAHALISQNQSEGSIIIHVKHYICKVKTNSQENLKNLQVKADFLSWQKSLAYSLRIFPDNFSLLPTLQRVLAAWFKIFNKFAIRSESMLRHNTTTVVVQDPQNGWTIGWLQWWNIAGLKADFLSCRNHYQRVSKYSLTRGTISCHRMSMTI